MKSTRKAAGTVPNSEADRIAAVVNIVRQRRYPARMPERIADVLANLMARRGYARIEAASQWAEAWRAAAGAKLAAHSRPGRLRRGVLEVTVRNSAVMQELAFDKAALIETLTRLLPEKKVRNLRFRVGTVE